MFCFGPIKYFILLPFQKQRILKANDLNRTPEEKEKAQEGKNGPVPLPEHLKININENIVKIKCKLRNDNTEVLHALNKRLYYS